MGLLFNRFVEVRFLKSGFVLGGRQTLTGRQVNQPPSIEFDIKHSVESSPNDAKVSFYNLSPETQRIICKEGEKVEIEAGYWPEGGTRHTGLIFRGQVRSAKSRNENGVETLTELELADGHDGISRARVRRNFGRTTHGTIVRSAVDAFGEHGIRRGIIREPSFTEARSRTVDRPARDELDDICRQHDFTWSVQDGALNIWPRDQPLRNTGYILEPETGVIGSPQFSDGGVEVQTLMLPDLRPGSTFTLRNRHVRERAPGNFCIQEMTFTGDNFGGEFGCQISARVVGANGKVRRSRERLRGNRT